MATERVNRYTYLFVLQGDYGCGWEDIDASESRADVRRNKSIYEKEEGGTYRIIERREVNEANEGEAA